MKRHFVIAAVLVIIAFLVTAMLPVGDIFTRSTSTPTGQVPPPLPTWTPAPAHVQAPANNPYPAPVQPTATLSAGLGPVDLTPDHPVDPSVFGNDPTQAAEFGYYWTPPPGGWRTSTPAPPPSPTPTVGGYPVPANP